jgi:hypothetical protein
VPVERPRVGRTAGLAGLASAALLAAAFRWAHHWSPLALAIVSGWGVATLTAFGASIRALCLSGGSRRLAKLGLWLAIGSLVALAVAGIAYAAGADPAGACGGG